MAVDDGGQLPTRELAANDLLRGHVLGVGGPLDARLARDNQAARRGAMSIPRAGTVDPTPRSSPVTGGRAMYPWRRSSGSPAAKSRKRSSKDSGGIDTPRGRRRPGKWTRLQVVGRRSGTESGRSSAGRAARQSSGCSAVEIADRRSSLDISSGPGKMTSRYRPPHSSWYRSQYTSTCDM